MRSAKNTAVKDLFSNNKRIRSFFYSTQRKIIIAVTLMVSVLIVFTFAIVNVIVKKDRYETLSQQYAYLNDKLLTSFDVTVEELDQLTAQFILNEYVQKSLTRQKMTAYDLEMMEKTLSYYTKSFWIIIWSLITKVIVIPNVM